MAKRKGKIRRPRNLVKSKSGRVVHGNKTLHLGYGTTPKVYPNV